MSAEWIWIAVAIVLIVSELMATSIVAVFLGIGALVTGLLLKMGVIESAAMQFTVFGLVSLTTLILARKKFKQMFGGYSMNQGEEHTQFQRDLGERVVVKSDFADGAGRVILNGVEWSALSDDELKEGDIAWVITVDGIRLTVAKNKIQTAN